ncbi:MAG: ExeM/NucH family extracellular endonuclease, partial [Flavobacteriales bacterium]
VSPTGISLPIASAADWERYEGMLLRFEQVLAVTGNEKWAQYGELALAPARLYQPTDVVDPNDNPAIGTSSSGNSNVPAVLAHADHNARSAIVLDDGRSAQYPSPPPLIGPQGTVRCGSTVAGLTGVLTFSSGSYRLHPVGSVSLQHAQRPAVPSVGGALRIAGMNVRNYFTTLGQSGASTSAELQRQRAKLVAALQAMNADAYLLCELENGDPASDDLLGALNAATGGGYAQINHDAPGSFTRSVILYRTLALTPVTILWALNTSTFERAMITQGFRANASGKRFLASMVHLRSKLCTNASGGNLDQGDGQGCYNARRKQQVSELLNHWAEVRSSVWIPGQLIMGDFNAYDQEDPIDRMRAAGLVDLVTAVPQPYTYQFGDAFGSLDHAFATTAMADAVTGAAVWHINSDEPAGLDYRDSNAALYQADAFRCSDHDPILVGIDPDAIPVGIEEEALMPAVRFGYDAAARMAAWEADAPIRVELLDALGRSVRAEAPGLSIRMDLSGLPAGAYAWRAEAGEGRRAAGRFLAW